MGLLGTLLGRGCSHSLLTRSRRRATSSSQTGLRRLDCAASELTREELHVFKKSDGSSVRLKKWSIQEALRQISDHSIEDGCSTVGRLEASDRCAGSTVQLVGTTFSHAIISFLRKGIEKG